MVKPVEIICSQAHQCSVLIIEDNYVDRMIFQHVFDLKNIKVTFCDDGSLAWNLINSSPVPDLVFLDLLLPEINGFKLLEHIRSKKSWNRVPVIVISGLGEVSDIRKVIQLGVTGYIHKPYDVRRLRDEIGKYLHIVDS